MGIGTTDYPPQTAAEWNGGSCDVMAVALNRIYGLPMMGEFEWGFQNGDKVLGYLVHAWVCLPDGRALDAAGPRPMFLPITGKDANDGWVEGYEIVGLTDCDPHLLWIREEADYVDAIRDMDAARWIELNLGSCLAELGIEPLEGPCPSALCSHGALVPHSGGAPGMGL